MRIRRGNKVLEDAVAVIDGYHDVPVADAILNARYWRLGCGC